MSVRRIRTMKLHSHDIAAEASSLGRNRIRHLLDAFPDLIPDEEKEIIEFLSIATPNDLELLAPTRELLSKLDRFRTRHMSSSSGLTVRDMFAVACLIAGITLLYYFLWDAGKGTAL
jgi:hypothetical protein